MPKKTLSPDTLLNPMPVVMACCQKEGERPNLITLAWVGVASSKPPTISIAVRPSRYSFDIISETMEFVIVVPDEKMLPAVDYCGTNSGRNVDKFEKTGLTAIPSTYVRPPLVEEAPVNLECKCTKVIELGVHSLFLGEVVAVHVEESMSPDKMKLDGDISSPIAYCYGGRKYRALGDVLGSYGFAKDKF